MNVSFWLIAISMAVGAMQATAAESNSGAKRFSEATESDGAEQPATNVITHHSLAAHLGLTPDDSAVFATPRTFRTESFNNEHVELEPLADSGS